MTNAKLGVPLLTYHDVTQHYIRLRRRYQPPPVNFTREEAAALRQLQTETCPNIHFMHKLYPAYYADTCPGCGAIPTTFHVTVDCTAACFPPLLPILQSTHTSEQWEGTLRDGVPELCHGLVRRARAVAEVGVGVPE
ncbi:hypothetical protein HPB50_016637 [Hyalomma asiaticum]|uniref:Uncharacterized protein n=1 Tax=Hyalomma asiaticum TaxID=266040 RepID=A0ACB7RQC7_HYAAI|nr:hypothetical protein HPB50_016637 [Hyalomma asiaticum]